MTVILVLRRIEQGDWSPPRLAAEFAECIRMLREFGTITIAKLCPAFRVMTEPSPEPAARRNFAKPSIELRLCLGDSARPQPVDEDSCSVLRGGGLIDPLEADISCYSSLVHDSDDLPEFMSG